MALKRSKEPVSYKYSQILPHECTSAIILSHLLEDYIYDTLDSVALYMLTSDMALDGFGIPESEYQNYV